MPEKNLISASLVLEMRKLKQKVERLDRRVRKIQEDADDRLTADDIAAIKEAKEDLRTGKTLRIA